MKLRILLAASLLALIAVPVLAQQTIFPDTDGHSQSYYIQEAIDNGWMQGYTDSTFKPDREITSGQMATVFDRVYEGEATRADFAEFLVRGFEERDDRWKPPVTGFPLPQFCDEFDDSRHAQLAHDFPGETCFEIGLGNTPPDLKWKYQVLGSDGDRDISCIYYQEPVSVQNNKIVVRSHMWDGYTPWNCHSIQMVFYTGLYEFWLTYTLEECGPWHCISRYSMHDNGPVVAEPELPTSDTRLTRAERVELGEFDWKLHIVQAEYDISPERPGYEWGQPISNAAAWAPHLVEIAEAGLASATNSLTIAEWTERLNQARVIHQQARAWARDAYEGRPHGSGPDPRLPDPEPLPWR